VTSAVSPKKRRINEKTLEEQLEQTERLWQEIQAAQPQSEEKERGKEEGVWSIRLGPGVNILLPNIEGLKIERKQEETGVYSLTLLKGGERLPILLDVKSKEVGMGSKDYRIREDKLVELAPWGLFDLIRRETKREFPLEKKEDTIIIDLGKIEDNSELRQFVT